MRFLSKKICLTFISSVLVTVLLMTLIPFNAITVSAVQGNGVYEIYVIDKMTNKPVEGARVVLDSDDDDLGYHNDFPNNGKKRTDSKGTVVYNLEQYFENRGWRSIRLRLNVEVPDTGYEEREEYIWPGAEAYGWQDDYTIALTPSDFADYNYLDHYINCIDIAYDSKPHYAHEFIDIMDNNAEITYENGKEPSFTEVGNYNIECYIKSKGYYDYDNNSEELYASIPVRIVKNTRTDFGFLIPEPADIAVPGNEKFSNPASSNLDPQPIVYSSSNPEIAVVDESTGDVDFKKAGTVTITATMPATANYAESKATYTISGKYSMSVSFTNSTLRGKYGATLPKNSLSVNGTPEPPASVTVSYELEGEDADEIASINSTTGIVTAKKPGTVTVKATASAKNYFSTEAKYTLNIGKGDRKVALGTNLEYGKTYPIFAEDINYGDWSYVIMEGKQYISVNKDAGEVTVIAAGGRFRIDIQSHENEYYLGLNVPLFGYAIKCPDHPVEFANDNGYQFTTTSTTSSFYLPLNGKAHYGDFSATWDGKGTEKDVIDSVVFSKDNNDNEFVVVTFKPGEAQKAQGPLNIYVTFDGGGNYEAKTIQTEITLGWDTSVSTEVVIECPTGKLVNGYYTAPVRVHPKSPDVKFQDPDGNIVSEYWLNKDGIYDSRSLNFYSTDNDGNPATCNAGTVGRILIDQTAPADFTVDITNPDNSNPLKKFFTTVFTFFAAKEWDITVTVKDAASGFDRIEYDCGDGVIRTVTTYTNTGSVSGSTALITGKFTVPVGTAGKVRVWAYDRAGNCISTHDDDGNLVPGFFTYEGEIIKTDVYVVVDNTKPVINVSFDNNSANSFKDGSGRDIFYFKDNRTAAIQIREDHYYPEDVEIIVTPHGSDVAFSKNELISKFGLKYDDSKQTIYLTFADEGWYDFDVKYTDRSGNVADKPVCGNSVAPDSFVIDKTLPVINVSYSNNDVHNESFFNQGRTAEISITESNFDEKNTNVVVTTKSGSANSNGSYSVDNWTKNGDTYVAYLNFNDDNNYKLDITCTDKAGNLNDGIVFANGTKAPEEFTVDTTAPTDLFVKVNGESVLGGNFVTFDAYYKDAVNITLGADCDASGVYALQYQIIDTASVFSIDNGKWIDYDDGAGITVSETKKFIVYFRAIDNASNVSYANSTGIVIYNVGSDDEKHAPDIDILLSQANSDGFYTGNVSANLTIADPAFIGDERDPDGYYSGLKEVKYTIYTTDTGAKEQGTLLDVSKGTGISGATLDDHKIAHSWTGTLVVNADKFNSNNVIVQIEAVDNAGNIRIIRTDSGAVKIDTTKPRITVSYDNNKAANTNYYKNTRTATVTIVDRNFSADRVNISIKATDDGAAIGAPSVSKWTSNGDTHTATINYNKDGKYVFSISAKDKAGNNSADFAEQTFYIDTTAPKLTITGVKDNSANSGDLAVQILYSDTNYSPDLVTITFSGANRGKLTPDGTSTPVTNGNKFEFKNFDKTKDNDDIYTLDVKVVDLAGNESTQKVTFTVNRFGSTFDMSDATKAINGKYMKDPVDIVVSEVNPNNLVESEVTLYKNGTPVVLTGGVDYDVKQTGGSGESTEYTYVIHSDNFNDDGVYSICISSVDEAGNVSENTLDIDGAALQFGVDNTVPDIVVSNLKDGTTYAADRFTAKVLISDNLMLDGVDVYLDDYDTPYKSWTEEELAAIVSGTGEFTFDITDASAGSHKVKIVATDAAGNKHEVEVGNFYVTKNLFVRFYTNTPLFVGSIIALLVIIAIVVFIVVMKRKGFRRR